MQQLPLDISAPEPPGFDNYVAGENAEALAAVRALAAGTLRESIVYLWGPPGSGRSHLLAAARRANAALVIADDVQRLATDAQQALFAAINAARESGRGVLAAGDQPPAALALREDLRTRLAWGLVYELRPLGDEAKTAHLAALAERRGLALPPEVAAYLLARLPRDFASLNQVMEVLDKHSLARQRGLTVPLVREALAAWAERRAMPRQAGEG
ncbi:MAG TPA: DnaA/Hda family protein [Burkholderiales bacterium]